MESNDSARLAIAVCARFTSGARSLEDAAASLDVPVPVLRAALLDAFERLPDLERIVLTARFGLRDGVPQTYGELARAHGVRRETIRVLEVSAMNRLVPRWQSVAPDSEATLLSPN